jgi:hypothetical protein
MNAAGKPRSWTDHLLWHHAAHTVDLFQYQAGEVISDCYAVQGPIHPTLGIAMDMGIVMKTPSGSLCTLSLSFNNDGPIGSFFRYICDNGTYNAYYDDLVDAKKNPIDLSKVDVSMDGIEIEDREFIAAIKGKREPNSRRWRIARSSASSRSKRRWGSSPSLTGNSVARGGIWISCGVSMVPSATSSIRELLSRPSLREQKGSRSRASSGSRHTR